jgi:hypothetical protein
MDPHFAKHAAMNAGADEEYARFQARYAAQRRALEQSTKDPPRTSYFFGLDLGQSQENTALAVVERTTDSLPGDFKRRVHLHAIRWLKRWPMGTKYAAIFGDLAELVRHPMFAYPQLAVHKTDVGQTLVDMLARAQLPVYLVPIHVTAGYATSYVDSWHVPKKELVTGLQIVLQARRLTIAKGLPEAETLAKELEKFRMRPPAAGSTVYESLAERDHDDLVFAVALACWLGERSTGFEATTPVPCDRLGTASDRLWARYHSGRSHARDFGLFGMGRDQDRRDTQIRPSPDL